MQSGETVKRTKSTRLPVFLMVIEHVAVQFPWLTIELNRVNQLISIEIRTVRGLNQVVFRI